MKACGAGVPVNEFLRDVLAEAALEIGELVARDLRRMRRAARRIRAAEDLIVAMTLAAAPVAAASPAVDGLCAMAFDPGELDAGLAETGVPRWHPEHHLNSGD